MDMLSLFGFLGGIGPTEMIVVGVIALLLFGNRVPDTMRSLGRGLKEFQDGVRGIEHDINKEADKEATR